MTIPNRILLIGLKPQLVNTSLLADSRLTAEKMAAGLRAEQERSRQAGYDLLMCAIEQSDTAEAAISQALADGPYACVVIGAGIRLPAPNLDLFERVLNAVHRGAPGTPISFNTQPADSVDAALRWA